MKTFFLKQIVTLLAMGIVIAGCNSKDDEQPTSLKGTKWKLAGIVNTQTGELRVLEPKDCEECYTLTFNTNSAATAYNVNRTIQVDILHSCDIDDMLWCERYEKDGKDYCDSDVFRRALAVTKSYTVSSDELQLYYGDNYYLLFKIQQK